MNKVGINYDSLLFQSECTFLCWLCNDSSRQNSKNLKEGPKFRQMHSKCEMRNCVTRRSDKLLAVAAHSQP